LGPSLQLEETPLGMTGPAWLSEEDIDAVTQKTSGHHFIVASIAQYWKGPLESIGRIPTEFWLQAFTISPMTIHSPLKSHDL